MYRFVLHRAVTMVGVLFGVSIITYVMIFFTPGDPAEIILTQDMQSPPTREEIQAFRVEHGLDEPIPVQYAHWIWDVLHGDLGQSYYQQVEVSSLIVAHVPETAELAAASMLVALLISVPAGILSAVHKGQLPDHVSQIVSLLGVSMPNFWLAYLLIMLLSLQLGVLPSAGDETIYHLIMPALTLGTGVAAIITRLLRSSMLEILDEDYVRTARSKGLRERIVLYKHALRNALIPVVTIVGLQFAYLLNGAVIVEIVFARPGLGRLLIDAIFARDYPIVQGTVLVIAVVFVLVNFLVDVAYRYIDPRIQLEGFEA